MPGSDPYFLEVSAHVSLKVTIKGSFRDKKIRKFSIFQDIFLNQKRRNATEKIYLSLINLILVYLAQLYIFWKQLLTFHWKQPPKALLEVKKIRKFSTFKAYFLNQKRRSETKKVEVSLTNLECSCLFQKHIFWK